MSEEHALKIEEDALLAGRIKEPAPEPTLESMNIRFVPEFCGAFTSFQLFDCQKITHPKQISPYVLVDGFTANFQVEIWGFWQERAVRLLETWFFTKLTEGFSPHEFIQNILDRESEFSMSEYRKNIAAVPKPFFKTEKNQNFAPWENAKNV